MIIIWKSQMELHLWWHGNNLWFKGKKQSSKISMATLLIHQTAKHETALRKFLDPAKAEDIISTWVRLLDLPCLQRTIMQNIFQLCPAILALMILAMMIRAFWQVNRRMLMLKKILSSPSTSKWMTHNVWVCPTLAMSLVTLETTRYQISVLWPLARTQG